VPRSVTAGRNYGEPAADRDLEALGVRMVAIPRKAKVPPAGTPNIAGVPQARQVAHRLRKPDQLSQAQIRLGSHPACVGCGGTAIWCAHGDFAHNLVKISALAS
jgi:IS5 family transposase